MSVATTTSKIQHTLTTGSQALAVPFYFLENAHIKAIRVATDTLPKADLVLGTDYTLTGAGNPSGGTLTTIATVGNGLAAGSKVLIKRNVPITQPTSYSPNDAFPAKVHEGALDRGIMIAQQSDEQSDRALRFPEDDSTSAELPAITDRALKALTFDENGAPVMTPLVSSEGVLGAESVGQDAIQREFRTRRVNSIAALRALSLTGAKAYDRVELLGYYAAGDGGGGPIRYLATGASPGTYTDNGGSVIVPAGGDGSAAWLWEYSGPYYVEWFGAKGDGTTNDSAAIQACITSAGTGGEVVLRGKTYKVSTGLTISASHVTIKGPGCDSIGNGMARLLAGSASMTICLVSGQNVDVQQVCFQGYETTSGFGEGTTCVGLDFLRGNSSKDIDSEATRCFFNQLSKAIKATGANLHVHHNTFQQCITGVDVNKYAAEENRGFRINDNRFHLCGGSSTDITVASSTCVKFTSSDAFLNQVNGNYADDCKYFFSGAVGHGSIISGNLIQRSRNTGIVITSTAWGGASGCVSGNIIGNQTGLTSGVDGHGIELNGCNGVLVVGNVINNVRKNGVYITNSSYLNHIEGNYIHNVNTLYAIDGTIYSGIVVDSGSNQNEFKNNFCRQSLAGGMQYGLNISGDENFFSENTVYTATGTNDFNIASGVMAYGLTESKYYRPRIEYSTSVPASGRWVRGDIVYDELPVAAGKLGWVCITSGTPGTWKSFGAIDA